MTTLRIHSTPLIYSIGFFRWIEEAIMPFDDAKARRYTIFQTDSVFGLGMSFNGYLVINTVGGVVAERRAGGRVATVAIEAMRFHLPVFVGDRVSCYAMCTTASGSGSPTLDVTSQTSYRGGARAQAAQELINQGATDANLMTAEFANIEISAASKVSTVNSAFSAAASVP